VTLTVEAGATVNLNGYELRVNGTLFAFGTITEQIRFSNGVITFTEYSAGWDEQTGSGSIFEFTVFEAVDLVNSGHVRVNDNHHLENDVVWTTANSPYSLVGQLIIGDGCTLTIEAGVTVNFNQYTMLVYGSVMAVGSTSNPIIFSDGSLLFGTYRQPWDESAGPSSRIEYAVLSHVELLNYKPLTIANTVFEDGIVQGHTFTLLNNEISSETHIGGTSVLEGNTMGSLFITQGNVEVINNTIGNMDCTVGSPVITGNNIYGIGSLILSEKDTEINYFVADSPVISNNWVTGGIYLDCTSAVVTNNTIFPRTYSISWTWWERILIPHPESRSEKTSGICIKGGAEVTGNTIYDCNVGIEGLSTVKGNTIYDCNVGIDGASTIEGNVLYRNDHGINVNSSTTIQNNLFDSNVVGVYIVNSPLVTIKENLFADNVEAINTGGNMIVENNELVLNHIAVKFRELLVEATIRNNAFADNDEGLRFDKQPLSLDFSYNNIENCIQNSIYLDDVTIDIDATNNWWGTTDSEAIGLKIYDSKYSFDVGTVSFSPFLTEPNPEANLTLAPPEPSVPYEAIPEFSSWILFPLFLVSTLVVVFCGKRFSKHLKCS
jgi:hypothetical protein